jgi:hypothetical protein
MSAKRRYNDDCSDARPSRPDVDLLWEKLRYFGKAVAIDHPDARSNSSNGQEQHPDARPKSESLV